MELDCRGTINILVISVVLSMLLSISLMLYQLNRMTHANEMHYNMNEARNLALALEEQILHNYQEQIGRTCGEINSKEYIVSVKQEGEGFKIFIVVEYRSAIYTIDLQVDSEGRIIKRLDNVPRGDISC